MSEKFTSEIQLKENLGINNWGELSKDKFLQYIRFASKIDKELHLKILEKVPNFIQLLNESVTNIINVAEKKKEVSIEVLNVLRAIVESLKEILNKDNITTDERMYAMDKIIEISKIVDEIDKRNAGFFDSLVNIIATITGFGILVLAVVFGVKLTNKK